MVRNGVRDGVVTTRRRDGVVTTRRRDGVVTTRRRDGVVRNGVRDGVVRNGVARTHHAAGRLSHTYLLLDNCSSSKISSVS